MKRKEFIEAIEKIKEHDAIASKLFELGIDILDCKDYELPNYFFGLWIKDNFGDEGLELVDWWLYEDVKKVLYKEGTCSKDWYYKDEECDGEIEADLTEIDDLYDYLLVKYGKNKKK